ncbi:hypothetical protein [Streptomyces sp. NPDC001108]
MIHCEITATARGRAQWVLSTHQATTPRLALRWLTDRARLLADQLDQPTPLALCPPPGTTLAHDDVPPTLRDWSTNPAEHEHALDILRDGQPLLLTTHDDATHYALHASPVPFPVPAWAPDPMPERQP